MVISLVSFGLFGPALSTTNINIVKWRYFVIFSPVFFCSLNWEFSYSNWEKNILFGIGNTTEYRSSKRAKKTPDHGLLPSLNVGRVGLQVFFFYLAICISWSLVLFQRLAKHVMNVHLNALQMTEEPAEGEIDLMTLKKYISYCRT